MFSKNDEYVCLNIMVSRPFGQDTEKQHPFCAFTVLWGILFLLNGVNISDRYIFHMFMAVWTPAPQLKFKVASLEYYFLWNNLMMSHVVNTLNLCHSWLAYFELNLWRSCFLTLYRTDGVHILLTLNWAYDLQVCLFWTKPMTFMFSYLELNLWCSCFLTLKRTFGVHVFLLWSEHIAYMFCLLWAEPMTFTFSYFELNLWRSCFPPLNWIYDVHVFLLWTELIAYMYSFFKLNLWRSCFLTMNWTYGVHVFLLWTEPMAFMFCLLWTEPMAFMFCLLELNL